MTDQHRNDHQGYLLVVMRHHPQIWKFIEKYWVCFERGGHESSDLAAVDLGGLGARASTRPSTGGPHPLHNTVSRASPPPPPNKKSHCLRCLYESKGSKRINSKALSRMGLCTQNQVSPPPGSSSGPPPPDIDKCMTRLDDKMRVIFYRVNLRLSGPSTSTSSRARGEVVFRAVKRTQANSKYLHVGLRLFLFSWRRGQCAGWSKRNPECLGSCHSMLWLAVASDTILSGTTPLSKHHLPRPRHHKWPVLGVVKGTMVSHLHHFTALIWPWLLRRRYTPINQPNI